MQSDAYASHAVWTTLEQLRERFERKPRPDTDDQRLKRDAIGAFIAFVEQYRDDEGLLIADNQMAQVHSNVSTILQHLQNLNGDSPNWGYLGNACAQVPGSTQYILQNFPPPTADAATAATKRAATMYRKTLDQDVEAFRIEIESPRDRLTESEQARVTQEQTLATELDALRAKAEESEQQLATHAARLVQQIAEQRTAYEQATSEGSRSSSSTSRRSTRTPRRASSCSPSSRRWRSWSAR